jgi:SAM-dependent methyltransferase
MSVWLSKRAGEYIACDLSASSLAHLEEKVAEVRVIQDDFLNSDFPVTSADVVYAHSVLHHFKHLGPALDKLRAVLQPDGVAVTHDPLITWPPYRWLRKALGTFKSDSAWEHPWRWQDLEAISTRFDVAHIQGLLGASKWGLLLTWAAETLHERDLRQATDLSSVGHCLRVAMCFHA